MGIRITNDIVTSFFFPFFLLSLAVFTLIVFCQYWQLTVETYRIQVLVTRASMVLPFYSILVYIQLAAPRAFVGIEIPLVLVEGYALYLFLAMLVINLGGPKTTLMYLNRSFMEADTSGGSKAYRMCCPKDPKEFFQRTINNVWHVTTTRVVVTVFDTICYYQHYIYAHREGYTFFTLVAAIILINGFAYFMIFCETVFPYSQNLNNPFLKVSLLKVAVMVIVFEGLVQQLMYEYGALRMIQGSPEYSAAEAAQRINAVLVLIQLGILAPFIGYSFTAKISPSPSKPSPLFLDYLRYSNSSTISSKSFNKPHDKRRQEKEREDKEQQQQQQQQQGISTRESRTSFYFDKTPSTSSQSPKVAKSSIPDLPGAEKRDIWRHSDSENTAQASMMPVVNPVHQLHQQPSQDGSLPPPRWKIFSNADDQSGTVDTMRSHMVWTVNSRDRPANIGVVDFFRDIIKFHDIFGILYLERGELRESLADHSFHSDVDV